MSDALADELARLRVGQSQKEKEKTWKSGGTPHTPGRLRLKQPGHAHKPAGISDDNSDSRSASSNWRTRSSYHQRGQTNDTSAGGSDYSSCGSKQKSQKDTSTEDWRENLDAWGRDTLNGSVSHSDRSSKDKASRRNSRRRKKKHSSTSSSTGPNLNSRDGTKARGKEWWKKKFGDDVDFEISDFETSDVEDDENSYSNARWDGWGGWNKYTRQSNTGKGQNTGPDQNKSSGPNTSRAHSSANARQRYFQSKREEYFRSQSKKQEKPKNATATTPRQQQPTVRFPTFDEYISKWQDIYDMLDSKDSSVCLTKGDFPWPTTEQIRHMLTGPGVTPRSARSRHRQLLLILHPDKFSQKFGVFLAPDEMTSVLESVTAAAQIVNSLKTI